MDLSQHKATVSAIDEHHCKALASEVDGSGTFAITAAEAINKLRAAGFSWAAIFALLIQGMPAIIALLQQLFPPTPPPGVKAFKMAGLVLAALLLLTYSANAQSPPTPYSDGPPKPYTSTNCGNCKAAGCDCIPGLCNCEIDKRCTSDCPCPFASMPAMDATKGLHWRQLDNQQAALLDANDKQLGVYLFARNSYHVFDEARWLRGQASPASRCPIQPPVMVQLLTNWQYASYDGLEFTDTYTTDACASGSCGTASVPNLSAPLTQGTVSASSRQRKHLLRNLLSRIFHRRNGGAGGCGG